MTNWKTTIAGLLTGAPVLIDAILSAYTSGQFTGKTVLQSLFAIGLILIGYLAQDAPIKTALEAPAVQQGLGFANTIVGLESASHPTNVLLNDVKQTLNTIAANTAPAATAAPASPAPGSASPSASK